MITRAVLKLLLPMACAWAEEQETLILRDGVALTTALMGDARQIGIGQPERVRLRAVERVPLPMNPSLRKAAESMRLISSLTIGLTLRYGIFVRSDCWGERSLVVHELVHTHQYERLGGFRPFLEQYLAECINPGYPHGPLEQEAKRIERETCGGPEPGQTGRRA